MNLEPEKPETGVTSAGTYGTLPAAQDAPDREPAWEEGNLDSSVVEAAKRVFERRRELLRRLA